MSVLVSYEPLLSDAAQVLCSSNYSDNTFEMSKLDLALLISGELMLFVEVSGSRVHEPLVHHLYGESGIRPCFSVFPIYCQEILVFLFFQKDIAHI